ncbi:MAG: alanine--tRNA ligase [Parcubacteria group bacterium]|nr:alanine--tRNA ligase [Parcubacteria group bacterium]|tara:strand:- start:17328 stop:19088 length:1761 start_codon:yes stop_codon:yes gene_type:complete
MTSEELKKKYLEFFKSKGHAIIPSASLIPENDPTVLFTTAGMHPLVPYLMGGSHPEGTRITDVQKCIRTSDIDEVGDSWHLTFFEMLGNWSLGDYFKKEAIEWSWEFLTSNNWLGLDPKRISVSVFSGDENNNIPFDQEAYDIWKSIGMPPERIYRYDKKENWWGPAGKTGPCGPDTEMYYDSGKAECANCTTEGPACDCGKFAEIWNNVFMQYNKTAEGKFEELSQKNVDTGMGVERTVAILNGQKNTYDTDLFEEIIKKIKELATNSNQTSERIIADHLRAATFILGDEKGISPSNLDQGYVLRRLIRRAIRHGKIIGITKPFSFIIAEVIIQKYKDDYNELQKNKDFIIEQLVQEEEKFSKTLARGLKEFEKISEHDVTGHDAFILFTTYGLPIEIVKDLAKENDISVDEKNFEIELKKHQNLSRTATAGKFKGGLADHSEETTRLHTTNHLTLQALRTVLGDHVNQKGSNITKDRLRFDFSHDKKMTPEEIQKVEDIVNEQINNKLDVSFEEMSVEEAKEKNAIGVFEHKYADKVKVYKMGDFSLEICGGPHVKNTGELGHFKITKEESSSAGVRRIKAVLQ